MTKQAALKAAVALSGLAAVFVVSTWGLGNLLGTSRSLAIAYTAMISLGLALIMGSMLLLPRLLTRRFKLTDIDRAKAENDARATMLQAIGSALLLLGALFTWRQLAATQQQLTATQQQVVIAQKTQVNDQFTRAIDQLGNQQSQDVRIGAIYSLTRLAQDAPDQRYPVLDILSSYIREHAPLVAGETPRGVDALRASNPDVEIALIHASGLPREGKSTILLDRSNLTGAALSGLSLSWVTFSRSDLRNAYLVDADLHNATLDRTDLRGASLGNTNLENAFLIDTDLRGTHIGASTRLTGALLQGTNLSGAQISASLAGTKITAAIVCGADLSQARIADIAKHSFVLADNATRWPPGFTPTPDNPTLSVELVPTSPADRHSHSYDDLPLADCH